MPAFQNDADLDALAGAVLARLRGLDQPRPDLPQGVPLVPERPNLPDLLPRRRLGVAGIELTQAIQHHGAAGQSHGADNAVPLVALKTMVARVYPWASRGVALSGDPGIGRVTGELLLMVGTRVAYRTGPTREDGVRVGSQALLDRTLWDRETTLVMPDGSGLGLRLVHRNASLNFIVPAYFCRAGRAEVVVRLWPVDEGPQSNVAIVASEPATFLAVDAPRLALVRVNWDNGMGTVSRPSDVAMLDTVRAAEPRLPFPYFDTTILSLELTRTGSFAQPSTAGGCNARWTALMPDLEEMGFWTRLFQLGSLVYGMLGRGELATWSGEFNSGCRIGGGAGSFVGEIDTFAHEIGHAYGRAHVAVAGDSRNDTAYPNYGGSATSIGEVGVDTSAVPPRLLPPDDTHDIMSYGRPQWTSPYTYRALLDGRAQHQSVRADPRRVSGWLLMTVRIHRTLAGAFTVETKKSIRVTAPGSVPPVRGGRPSPFTLSLIDRDDRLLAARPLMYLDPQGCGCQEHGHVDADRAPFVDFVEALPWPDDDEVAGVVVHHGREPIAVIRVGECPSLEIGEVRLDDAHVSLDWQASHERTSPAIIVFFSGDDGETWEPVAVDPAPPLRLPVASLRGGQHCRLRVLASAELCSVARETASFDLPQSGRRVHIAPQACDCLPADQPVTLRALVDSRGVGPVSVDQVHWQSSVQGPLGAGLDITVRLDPGVHEVTVTVPDGLGRSISERAIIIVGGRPVAGRQS